MDINSLKLKKFEGRGAKISRKIGITKSNSFGFPPTFYKENNLDNYNYANLYFDQESNVIGVEFSVEREDGAFTLSKHGINGKKSASFVARSFFKTYKIDPRKYYGRYDPKVLSENNKKIFVFEIKENKDKNNVTIASN